MAGIEADIAGLSKFMAFGHFSQPWKINGLEGSKDMTESPALYRRFGYARVSTYGQTLDAQLERLRAEGCTKIYRERAPARGQRMGRPLKLTPAQRREARDWRATGVTLKELAERYGVARATISRACV